MIIINTVSQESGNLEIYTTQNVLQKKSTVIV